MSQSATTHDVDTINSNMADEDINSCHGYTGAPAGTGSQLPWRVRAHNAQCTDNIITTTVTRY